VTARSVGVTVTDFDTISVDYLRSVVGKKWSTYPDCIGAFVAETDFGTAPPIQRALREIVDEGFFGYTPDAMLVAMQQACADWYRDEYGWAVPWERVRPLPDVLKGLEETIRWYTAPGSKIIVPTPAYMPFLTFPKLLRREHIEVPMRQVDGRWTYDYDVIDAAFADGGGLLVLCNPHNPLGIVNRREELVQLSEIVDRHGGRVFADEIHSPVTYPGHVHIPYASISEMAASHTLTAVSASKAWNLAGLKCAQIILSNDVDAQLWKEEGLLAEHSTGILGIVSNTAAYSAGRPWLNEILEYLDGNRMLLGELLAELMPDAAYTPPEGTYLAWIDIRNVELDVCSDIFFREKAKVAIVDGIACGEAGKGYIRFNIALPRPLLEQAVLQMADAIRPD
jgi:cysteine-S-conjugate beta-lyase